MALELQARKIPGLYRNHDDPSPADLAEFADWVEPFYGRRPTGLQERDGLRVLVDLTKQDKAEAIAHASNARVETIGRVDDEIDRGIVRTAIERDASLVICGWRGYSTYQDSFFGSTIDNVARQLPIPVLIARFVGPVANTDRVFLAVTNKQALSPEFKQTLNIAKMLSKELKTSLEVLSIATNKQSQLSPQELSNLSADTKIGQAQGNFIKEVSQKLYKNDLLLLPVKTSETMIRSRSAVILSFCSLPWFSLILILLLCQ